MQSNNETLEHFVRKIPKMTNLHVHLFAMLPVEKFIKLLSKIDDDLYRKINILERNIFDNEHKLIYYAHTLNIINDYLTGNTGFTREEKTDLERNDWIPLHNIENIRDIMKEFIIRQHLEHPFDIFEVIQARLRIVIRHYKFYYYYWYATLYQNFKNNIFYLNVRGKPGSITHDTSFDKTLFLRSTNILPLDEFENRVNLLVGDDRDIKPKDYGFMYGIYTRIKYEADLIMLAVQNFNNGFKKPHYISSDALLELSPENIYKKIYDNTKQMMVQYIITFPKEAKPQGETDEIEYIYMKQLLVQIKQTLYVAVVINQEYDFTLFNGIDLVGYEQKTRDLSEYIPILKKLLYFRKFGINTYPHLGESNVVSEEISLAQKYIIEKKIERIGHGITFLTNKNIEPLLIKQNQTICLEICPISNYLLGYYKIDKHPAKEFIHNKNFRITINSDDNGLFGYTTVSHDYLIIIKHWGLENKDLKRLISNGLFFIPREYQDFYRKMFVTLWNNIAENQNQV